VAQTPAPPPVLVPSVSLLLPNYNSVPLGESASIEGGAFLARANDSSAGFFNPAGLAHAERSSISGSAGAYQFGSVTTDDFDNVASTFQQIPALFGVVVNDLWGRPNWAGGLSIARVNAWHQTVDAEVVSTGVGTANRFRFSTDAGIDAWLASLGVGYQRSSRLRIGVTIDGQYTSVTRRQSIATQAISTTELASLLVGSNGSAWAAHLRATVGTQYEVSPAVRVGLVMRTPGWTAMSGGSSSLEGATRAGATSITVSFFDPAAESQLKLPFEFKTGVAWIGARAQVEVDLFTYMGTGRYAAVESDQVATIITDDGQGRPPVVTTQVYESPTVDSRAVVNVAIGGRYALTENGAWTLHAGYATDRSPVGDDDTTFTKVHLQSVTTGVSMRTKWLLGSLGVHYTNGQSDSLRLHRSSNGTTYDTAFTVSNLGLVYSLAVLF
jgi:hypothetical protein